MLVMDDDDAIPEEWLAQVFESCHAESLKKDVPQHRWLKFTPHASEFSSLKLF
jgi:hypothetical protein